MMTEKLATAAATATESGVVRTNDIGQARPQGTVASQNDDWGERVAHELRGPAGVTLGAIDELELALGASADQHKALLAMARRGIGKVLRTAERLSRKAQLDSGRAVMASIPVDLRELITRARSDAEQLEARRGIDIVLEPSEGSWQVTTDESWATLAVVEVLSLAIKSARREVRVSLARVGDRPAVVVSDDGRAPTIPANQTGHASPTDRRTACLSLPLAHGIARALGGELTVEGVPTGNRRVLRFA